MAQRVAHEVSSYHPCIGTSRAGRCSPLKEPKHTRAGKGGVKTRALLWPSPLRGSPTWRRAVHIGQSNHPSHSSARAARNVALATALEETPPATPTAQLDRWANIEGGDQKPPLLDMNRGPRLRHLCVDSHLVDSLEYDITCDVRSPGEYEEDRVLGAISTPVLDDEERARVGTLYKQRDPFHAKKVGSALVAANLSKIIEEHFMDREKGEKVLVYCWRGGERSLSLAHTLCRIGFDVTLLQGGYRAYRQQVMRFLERCGEFNYVIIAGRTGSAKGKLLDSLQASGAQVLDLEGAASHRGSILGQDPATNFTQPSQKLFDSRIFHQMQYFETSRPVFVEGESSKVGIRHVPQAIWMAMKVAKVVEVHVPMPARVAWIRAGYEHFETTHVSTLKKHLKVLARKRGHETSERWISQVEEGAWDTFVQDILENHYDPGYAAAGKRDRDGPVSTLTLQDTSDDTYAQAARDLMSEYSP
ncbi:hypothetical protein CYMTET_56972 [Cymbomonas tetramitiformis]|uniref:Rhodanese domain-containing protein n=1 Tax=Cymbomonas tetramitiformis TaxID=36881 RepID=A0AAE0ELA8_9CHLO|nr:hypothetical protein CYMTET_56972 [Cymbomonas tetramitiformis]